MRDLMKKPFFITLTCSAHTLNLLAKDLEIPGVTVHAIKVIKYFRNNHFARAKFQELKIGKSLCMPQEVRWNTMCFSLASYIENWPILLRICENYKDNIDSDISNIVLNINIKRNIEDLLSVLQPIADCLQKMQSSKCKINDAVFLWKTLEQNLKNVLNTQKMKLFKKRYEKALDPAHFLAFLLTPKYIFNEKDILLSKNEKDAAFEFLKEKFGKVGENMIPKIMKFIIKADPFDSSHLLSDNTIKNLSALEWWKACKHLNNAVNDEEMNVLTILFTTCSSSADIERIFSTFNLVQSKLRNTLGNEKTAKLVFIFKCMRS